MSDHVKPGYEVSHCNSPAGACQPVYHKKNNNNNNNNNSDSELTCCGFSFLRWDGSCFVHKVLKLLSY